MRICLSLSRVHSRCAGKGCPHQSECWLRNRWVRAERENCCDDAVVALRGDAVGYAAALAALEARRSVAQPALAATGGNLMKRVRRLLEPERPRSVAGPVLAVILLLAPIAMGFIRMAVQTAGARAAGSRSSSSASAGPRSAGRAANSAAACRAGETKERGRAPERAEDPVSKVGDRRCR